MKPRRKISNKPRRKLSKAPLGVVKRNEFEFDEWLKKQHGKAAERLANLGMNPSDALATEAGWLMCLPKFQGKYLNFDGFQLGFLKNKHTFRAMLKSRQIGFSFAIACESLARCHLKDRHRAVCVSYNLDDAKAKVEIAKELHDEMPLEFQKQIVVDKKTEVGFRSNSSKRRLSTIISFPSKPPRGKTGDVYLDELAHCVNDESIYTGATALIVRSGGQLTMGSTPLGQRGKFHEVFTGGPNGDLYSDYWRQSVPWWLCSIYCRDIPRAALEAPYMKTHERVAKYGTNKLLQQFKNNTLEDFQQEFECSFQDERVSFYPYDTILPCATKDWHEIPVYRRIEELASVAGKLDQLSIGFDVGRSGHPSEMFIFEESEGEYVTRYTEQFRNMKFPDQRARIKKIMGMIHSHVRVFRIDSTGLGRDLAETLQRVKPWGKKVVLVEFTLASKNALANSLKILLEEKRIVLPRCKHIIGQIHSIKKKYTAAGNEVFDSDKSKRAHADKMWAIALGSYTKRQRKRVPGRVGARVVENQAEKIVKQIAEPKTLLEKMFSVPDEKLSVPEQKRLRANVAIVTATPEQLLERAAILRTAFRVYKRDGMEPEAKEAMRQYRMLRRMAKRTVAS